MTYIFKLFQVLLIMVLMVHTACTPDIENRQKEKVKIMTLNPGHFHAALVQKNTLDGVDNTVHIYAPEGPDLDLHMERIEGFNTRDANPTDWISRIYTGDDYLQKMLQEQPGNVLVTAGNNQLKTDYILRAVQEGIHVLSDKPMTIDREGWKKLVQAFDAAEKNNKLVYDIMTERFEVTSRLLRILMQDENLFGSLKEGSPDEPAIYKESVHHLFKTVAGSTLRRPPWYFDVTQQGEGIVDVTVHLVDLSMWLAYPEKSIDYTTDIKMVDAQRWPTVVSRKEFEAITGMSEFPAYLTGQLDENGALPLYCNGEINYKLKDHHIRVMVQWDYQAPPGGDDRHYTKIRGTRANLIVRQGEEQDFKATVYIEPAEGYSSDALEAALENTINRLQVDFSGASYEQTEKGFKLNIPDRFHYGHEAHFGMVAQNFFQYLSEGSLPDWEVPNMITKYYITTQAREMAMQEE